MSTPDATRLALRHYIRSLRARHFEAWRRLVQDSDRPSVAAAEDFHRRFVLHLFLTKWHEEAKRESFLQQAMRKVLHAHFRLVLHRAWDALLEADDMRIMTVAKPYTEAIEREVLRRTLEQWSKYASHKALVRQSAECLEEYINKERLQIFFSKMRKKHVEIQRKKAASQLADDYRRRFLLMRGINAFIMNTNKNRQEKSFINTIRSFYNSRILRTTFRIMVEEAQQSAILKAALMDAKKRFIKDQVSEALKMLAEALLPEIQSIEREECTREAEVAYKHRRALIMFVSECKNRLRERGFVSQKKGVFNSLDSYYSEPVNVPTQTGLYYNSTFTTANPYNAVPIYPPNNVESTMKYGRKDRDGTRNSSVLKENNSISSIYQVPKSVERTKTDVTHRSHFVVEMKEKVARYKQLMLQLKALESEREELNRLNQASLNAGEIYTLESARDSSKRNARISEICHQVYSLQKEMNMLKPELEAFISRSNANSNSIDTNNTNGSIYTQ